MSGPQSSRGFIYSFNHLMFTEHLFFPLFFSLSILLLWPVLGVVGG